ncbi:hypothetical protein Z043-125243 [Arapaima gigas]
MTSRIERLAKPKPNLLKHPERSVYWLDELPPRRRGTATAFGKENLCVLGSSSSDHLHLRRLSFLFLVSRPLSFIFLYLSSCCSIHLHPSLSSSIHARAPHSTSIALLLILSPLLFWLQARIKFPVDYPYSPPTFRFLSKMWHPNIYENGDVCISILHPPVDDPQSGELPSERWNPTQNVRTILLSVISLLNEPNTFSPANVDASVMYRKWRESKGKDREYAEIIRKQVLATKAEAERDGVKVPTTLAEYCVQTRAPAPDEGSDLFYDEEDLDDEDDQDCCYDEDDSGTEDS